MSTKREARLNIVFTKVMVILPNLSLMGDVIVVVTYPLCYRTFQASNTDGFSLLIKMWQSY